MTPQAEFGLLNTVTLFLYLAAMFGIGVYCARFNKSTDDFFRGGQSVPWWAAGLSIFATMLSSITYMAMPAKSYATDWVIFVSNLPILLLAPVVIIFFLPVYRRIDATSAYEYLEKRFNYGIRLFGVVSFVLLQTGRMAVVLYLPSLALSTVTDLNLYTSIAIMGAVSIAYSVIGGIQAVIWTDVVQSVVLLGGAVLSFAIILSRIDGGLGSFFEIGSANDKFRIANLGWDVTLPVLWIVFLGSVFNHLIPLTSDQSYVQRYMSTATEKQAAKAIWVNSAMAVPATFLFLSLGTAMFVYYQQYPDRLGSLPSPDAILPWFISRELPAGIAGLVVAGIFAAAQSTVSTSMNSISTVITIDVVHRWRGKGPEVQELRRARVLTVIFGGAGMAAAFYLAAANVQSMFDAFIKLMGLTGSALAGLFILGIFTRRTTARGAACGAGTGIVVLYLVQGYTSLTFFTYAPIGMLTCIAVGYGASRLIGPNLRSLQGLTYFTIDRAPTDVKTYDETIRSN